jgi:hypothetical protein
MNEPSMDDKIQQMVTAVLEAVDARLDGIRHELVRFAADADQRHHDVLSTVAGLKQRVDELADRPEPTAASSPPSADTRHSVADLNERMAQATKILVERLEAAHRDAAMATERKVTQLTDQIEALRSWAGTTQLSEPLPTPLSPSAASTDADPASATPAPVESQPDEPMTSAPAPAMSGSFSHITGQLPHLTVNTLEEISRPLYEHGHVTAPTPLVSDTARLRQVTGPPMPPLVPTSMSSSLPSALPSFPAGTPTAHAAHEDIDIARLTSLINEKLDHLSLPNRPD